MSKIIRLIFSAVLALMLFSGQFCGAAPPMPQYLSDTADLTDLDTAQNLMEQELRRQLLRNWAQETENAKDNYDIGDLNRTGFRRLISQKRGANALQKQTRTGRGGVALCLWKVCPAGPWLVAKK